MPSQHIWTEKDEEGRKREVRAIKFGAKWRLQSKVSDENEWIYHDPPLLDDLLKLKEIIARKYQRRRASADDVASVGRLISEQQANEEAV
jgi:hypothetical protein